MREAAETGDNGDMKKLLARLIWVPLGLIVVVFLVANRTPVAVSLDPISVDDPAIATPPLPLWIWLALSLLLGVAAGSAGMWLSGRDRRIKARAEHRELKAMKREIANAPPPGETLPILKAS